MATARRSNTNGDPCALCKKNHNRIKTSVCQCKHCALPMCIDCMKLHNDEVNDTVNYMQDQYNETKLIIEAKQNMITNISRDSIKDISLWFENYLNELILHQQKILSGIEKEKIQAQAQMDNINDKLQEIGSEIRTLTKSGIFQATHIDNLKIKLINVQKSLQTFDVTKDVHMPCNLPKYEISFQSRMDNNRSTRNIENEIVHSKSSDKTVVLNKNENEANFVLQNVRPRSAVHVNTNADDDDDDDNEESPEYSSFNSHNLDVWFRTQTSLKTRYEVDRIANDGQNLLFSSTGRPDYLVYYNLYQK
ncbi:unnamed protein product, partial [Didymodactylos carnosus]